MTTQAWAWPDATLAVVEALGATVTAPVVTRIPSTRPAAFVRVQRVGGPRGQVLDVARILTESWAASEFDAWALAATVRETLRTFRSADVVGVAESGGPSLLADPETGTPRYLITFDITLRPSAAL